MFRTTYYSTRHQPDASNQDVPSGEMNTNIDENILSISKCLEEADIYVATSKSYVEASRGKIELLKKSLCQADVDLCTAGECIMESEMRISHLKQELQSLFNKSFYSRPETVQKEIVDESRLNVHRTICEPHNCSLPSNISNALRKYANRLKIDLKNYKTSFEQHDNFALVVMHPLHRENNHCNPFWCSQDSSLLQQCTSNSDNLKKKNDSFHEENVSKSSYSQTRSDDVKNISYIDSSLHPCLPISEENTKNFSSGSSERFNAFVSSQESIRSDVLNYNTDRKMLNESVVTSGTLDSNSNMSLQQNKTLDTPGTLESNSNMSLATLDKVPDLVNNLNGLTFDRQSVESRKWSRLDSRLPPRKRYGSSDVSPIRLSESSDLPSRKPSRAGSSKHVLVKIHSSDSGESEWESTQKSEDCRKTPKDDMTKNRNETEDLIKLSSSGSSETSPLLLKESGCQNTKANANVSIDMKMGAGSELSFSQDTQISNSFKSINSSYDSNTFTKNYLQCTQPDNISHLQSCRPKTLSQSFREKCTREKEASAVFDDCLKKVRLSIITKNGNSETFGGKKLIKYSKNQSQESDVENITLDGLSLTGSVEINDGCINPLSSYDSTFDYSQPEPFGISQYKKKSKLTSTENLSASVNSNLKSESFNGMKNTYCKTYKKLTKESDDTTYSSVGKSSTSGNITTSSSSHSRENEFYSLQAKKELTSKSPSYFSLTEDVFYSTQNTDSFKEVVSASDVASASIAMNTSCSAFAGNSNSNVLQTDNSFSSGNANTSASINVNMSDASITSESQRTANETFSKPLFENTCSSDDFAVDNFEESLRRRDSTESYVTVYEAQAACSRDSTSNYNRYESGQLSQRSGLEVISEEYNTPAASIPRVSITSHSRNAVYTYIPKARMNTSTPKPESSLTEI